MLMLHKTDFFIEDHHYEYFQILNLFKVYIINLYFK
jgi:hypothetical protein